MKRCYYCGNFQKNDDLNKCHTCGCKKWINKKEDLQQNINHINELWNYQETNETHIIDEAKK